MTDKPSRAADDFDAIQKRLEELKKEREEAEAQKDKNETVDWNISSADLDFFKYSGRLRQTYRFLPPPVERVLDESHAEFALRWKTAEKAYNALRQRCIYGEDPSIEGDQL